MISKGHSGSTLAHLLISSHPSVTGVGEIINLHKYVKPDSEKNCTCGLKIHDCTMWGNVLNKNRHDYTIPVNEPTNFIERNYNLLHTINEVNQTSWICDISKSTERLTRLLKSDLFNVTILHLIRDGRAVAYSYLRKRKRLNRSNSNTFHQRKEYLTKYSYFMNIRSWHKTNVKIYNKYKNYDNYHVIKYEDLVDKYHFHIKNIWNEMGINFNEEYLNHVGEGIHIVGGNRMKRNSEIKVEKDIEYKNKINTFNWFLSSLYLRSSLQMFDYKLSK